MNRSICAAVVCTLAAVSQSVSAAPVVGSLWEPFSDYGTTTFITTPPAGQQNGGSGWNTVGSGLVANDAGAGWGTLALNAGTARTVNAPGLTYSATNYVAPTGNKLTLDAATGNATQNIGRTLGGQTIDTGTTYFSFLVSRNTADTNRTINLAFFNGTTERFAVGQIGTTAGNTAGNIGLLMNNSNPAGLVQNTTAPIAMGNSVTHLIVGRIDWNAAGNETVSLWVDPTDVTSEILAGPTYVSTSGFELTAITGIRPFAGNNATGFPAVSANFDEIRLGGTWEQVTSLAPVVPEPATTGLLAAGLFALTGLRRRRAH